jgi:1D-myo-inositol 3-kinase
VPSSDSPQLLVLGHVTRDELPGGQVRLGGAAAYGALAAARLGVSTALCTVAAPDDPVLAELRATRQLQLHVVPAEATTTFALAYEAGARQLVLRRRARPLTPADVPAEFRAAAVVYVGPVAAECDRALIDSLAGRFLGVGLQGWLRRRDADGRIHPALSPGVIDPPAVGCAIVSVEDHPDVEAVAVRFAAKGAVAAITRGARGATLLTAGDRLEIPAAPAREVDPTGAGDVFGVVLTWRLAAGASPETAATEAAAAAARVVEGPGLGRL